MSFVISQQTPVPTPEYVPRYSPSYPWAETGVVLFLVFGTGLVLLRWLPGFLRRREADARTARDEAWLINLKREADDREIRNILLSKHLNLSQIHLDDLQTTQQSISALAEGQRELQKSILRGAAIQANLLRKILSRMELISADLKGLRHDVRGDALFSEVEGDLPLTRPKGVGQSPDKSVFVENSGIDL